MTNLAAISAASKRVSVAFSAETSSSHRQGFQSASSGQLDPSRNAHRPLKDGADLTADLLTGARAASPPGARFQRAVHPPAALLEAMIARMGGSPTSVFKGMYVDLAI